MNTNEEVAQGYMERQLSKDWRDLLEKERVAPQAFHSAEIRAVCDAMKLFSPEVVARLLLRWEQS